MQTNVFPQTYNNQVDERTRKKEYDVHQKSNSCIQSINRTHTSAPDDSGLVWGGVVGFFGGFIACSCICINNDSAGAGFATWVIIGIISLVLGALIDKSVSESYKSNEENIAYRIDEEKRSLEKEIKKIRGDAQKDKLQYHTEFEKNAQNISVRFAESELAKEVIDWMTDGFCRTIDAADRRSHVEQIRVPFVFNVFNNKITCNLGTFDFELKRCRNLENPLEQTALARAIVSVMQLNIIMKYPKDASGTDISIDISYSYTNEYPVTTITYIAPNGNYKAVRGW